jgi:hypothetical protein
VVTLIPGPTSTVAPTLTPTINVYLPTATPRPGELAVGLYVQVKGTEGQGLKVRKAPGLDSEMVFLAYDAEIFMLKDGPLQEDGYTWWYLEAPYDSKRTGWTVSDYLEYVASP